MRSLWWHTWTLGALALAPVIDVLRRDPAFLVANDFGLPRLLALIGACCILAPLPLALPAWGLRASKSAWPALLLAPPAAAIGLALGAQLGLGTGRLLPALVLAAALCWAYPRHPGLRRYLGWVGALALLAPLHLLLDPGVRRLNAAVSAEPGATEDSARPPVVFVVLDELPLATLLDSAGAIDRRRFPNLASLADQAHWFTDLRSVDPATERAVPALLAGRIPPPGALPVVGDLPENLFTAVKEHYRIAAVESVSRLCPSALNSLLKDGRALGGSSWLLDIGLVALHVWTPPAIAAHLLPSIDRVWQGSGDRRDHVAGFRRLVHAIDGRPAALYFAHLMLPHRPWIYLPDGEVYLADGYREMTDYMLESWPAGAEISGRAYQRHLLQAEFTDRLVGELFDRLRGLELFDRALVVVTADHGISFRARDKVRRLSDTNAEDLLRVPLLLKLPNQREGEAHPEPRSSLDIVPTVLDALDLPTPATMTGDLLLASSPVPGAAPADATGLAHRRAIFGELEDRDALFAFGRYAGWVGVELAEASLPRHPEMRAKLLGQGATIHRAADAPVPAWVFGWVEGPLDLAGYGLAVAVDGTVRATGECQRVAERNRFNVLLPPWYLPPGEHQLELLLLEPGTGRGWRLPT